MTKHEAMFDFIKQYPKLNKVLYFNSIKDMADVACLNPVFSDDTIMEYTTGNAEKEYTFAIAYMKQYDNQGTSKVNINAINEVQDFMQWIDEQNDKKNFPVFPDNCFINRIKNLYDMPQLAGTDGQKAEYLFQCKVEYTEERSK